MLSTARFESAVNVFGVIREPAFWQAVANQSVGAALAFSAEMTKASSYLQAGFDLAAQTAKSISFSDAVKVFQSQWGSSDF